MAGMDMTEVSKIEETNGKKPLGVVVFYEEPYWSIIEGLLQWNQTQGPIQVVVICHTSEELLARSPQRLQRFLELFFTGIRTELHPLATDSTPQEIRDKIQSWCAEFEGYTWIMDTSGCHKSVISGLSGMVGTPETRIVSRNPSGSWCEWTLVPDTLKITASKLEGVTHVEMPAIQVVDLIRSQFNGPVESMDFSCDPVNELPVKRLTQEGISRGWNWSASFAACGFKGDQPLNNLFEQYVGAGLKEAGIASLAFHIRQTHKKDRKETLEIDLVASHGRNVLALDLKMPAETEEGRESLIEQLQKAVGNRQRLAGLGARIVLVRPGRLYTDAERDLAKNCGIELIDQRDTPRLFSRLASWLHIASLPQEIAEVEALLIEQVAQRGRKLVLVGESARVRLQEADSGASEWVDLEAYLNRLQVERGQNWILWANRNEIGLRLDRPSNPPVELPDLIQAALSRFGRVRVDTLPNGYEAVFMRDNNRLAKLRQALAGFVNRRLETMVFVQVRSHNPPAATMRPPVRPSKPTPALPVDYGTLNDLDAAVDQVFKPKPPRT